LLESLGFRFEDIAVVLGEQRIDVASLFPESSALVEKTGIPVVWESSRSAYAMALEASASVLSRRPVVSDSQIELILYVTQSPMHELPSHACMLQSDLGLERELLALDINQGCSGFVQALVLALNTLSEAGSALLVTTDTYRRKLDANDRSTSAIFSDGAAATLITRRKPSHRIVSQLHFTDGSGAKHLHHFGRESGDRLVMNGREVFLWTHRVVLPQVLAAVQTLPAQKSGAALAFLHQASSLVLNNLSPGLTSSGFVVHRNLQSVGNTVSSSIPILMSEYLSELPGKFLVLAGFGVGLSASAVAIAPMAEAGELTV